MAKLGLLFAGRKAKASSIYTRLSCGEQRDARCALMVTFPDISAYACGIEMPSQLCLARKGTLIQLIFSCDIPIITGTVRTGTASHKLLTLHYRVVSLPRWNMQQLFNGKINT